MDSKIVIRRARAEDVPELQSFTRNTFTWGDYVADALPEWLNEPGDLWVADAAGKPVGVNHVRYLSEDEAWFEGVRVHPDYRRLGIGRLLTETSIRKARERGARLVRVSIDGDNFRSQGMSQSIGFVLVDELIDLHKELPAGLATAADQTAIDGITVVAASPSDAGLLAEEAAKSIAYIGCDYTWRKVGKKSVLTDLTNGVRVMMAKDADGAIRGGTWFGSFFVEPDNEQGGRMTVMAELGSIFGDEPAIRVLVHWAENTLAEKRERDELPAAKLFANCRKSIPARSILPTLGFRPEEHGLGLWELSLLVRE
jgi:N-acetylglutamate synthase-like GNAT family acetyltransferase